MKDARGHGSNGFGRRSFGETLRTRLNANARHFGGMTYSAPKPTNVQAAKALESGTLKSNSVPVHDAMRGYGSNLTTGRAPTGLGDRISGVLARGQSKGERIASAAWRGLK